MHILIAPNAFKNSLDAASAAEAIETGLLQSKLDCTCERFPVGDGGDGTAAILIKKLEGKSPQVLAKGVVSYDLAEDGSLIYSNGSAIYRLGPQGHKERLHTGVRIEQVVFVSGHQPLSLLESADG